MNNVWYQVFLSSTYNDLIDERKEVTQAILESHCIPSGMELFPASNKTQWEFIKNIIDESDIYILVVAGRYGSEGLDDNGNKISYTEMEFDYAVRIQKPIIALIHRNISVLPNNKCESSNTKKNKLKRFIDKIQKNRMIKYWDNKDNLKSAVLSSLIELRNDDSFNAAGFVRANNEELFVEDRNMKSQSINSGDIEHYKELYNKVYSDYEVLRSLIYKAYYNRNVLDENDIVDEIIESTELAAALARQHE